MCGIFGSIAPPDTAATLTEREALQLRDRMAHRGPDDAGLLVRGSVLLAHRRLAIRDAAAGQQPWVSPSGNTAIVYNGELYNDAELRERLGHLGHRFRTRCDTELMPAAYETWGTDCVSRFRGDFAFGLYDFANKRLLLARDRCGVKPLFYSVMGQTIVFASSVSAIRHYPAYQAKPNWRVLSHYLTTLRLTLGSETCFEGIYSLEPGHRLVWNASTGHCIVNCFAPPLTRCAIPSEDWGSADEAVDRLEPIVQQAVCSRLTGDESAGMFLSGGVDSSLVAATLRDAGRKHVAAGVGTGPLAVSGDDDAIAAGDAARMSGVDLTVTRVAASDYRDRWHRLVADGDLPLATPSDVIIAALAEQMRSQTRFVLGGEGADELFYGYQVAQRSGFDYETARWLMSDRWPGTAAARSLVVSSLKKHYGRLDFSSPVDHYFALHSLIPTSVKPHLLQPTVWAAAGEDESMAAWYGSRFAECGEIGNGSALPRVLHRVNLEALLSRLDFTSMSAGLEVRPVFTDEKLIEFASTLPDSFKLDVAPSETAPLLAAAHLEQRGTLRGKRMLRKLARRMMPARLADQPKRSFPTPLLSWLRTDWSPWARNRILSSTFLEQALQPSARREIAMNPAAAGLWLWPLLNLALWGDAQF